MSETIRVEGVEVPQAAPSQCGHEGCEGGSCSHKESEAAEYHQATFAVLLALVPLLVFTTFSQAGLF